MSRAEKTLARRNPPCPAVRAAILALVLALPAGCAGPGEPVAAPPPAPEIACALPLADALAALRRLVPDGRLSLERHAGDRARAAVDAVNAIEPESDFTADEVTVAYLAGAPGAIVFLSTASCVTVRVMLPAADARRLGGRGV